ncbi:MAG TPA: PadR family transcriptional regulator, partial [Candidatus Fraserbacteria bacterium]|nr:PadR family transcriptional regulator [Candidatus Fraserbacteria bacterium]
LLREGARYGLEIIQTLEERSGLVITEGTIYPLLGRLKSEGLLEAEWVASDAGHPRKYYRLSAQGRRQLLRMIQHWRGFSAALDQLIAESEEMSYAERAGG